MMKNTSLLIMLGLLFFFILPVKAQQRFILTIQLEENHLANGLEVWLDDVSGDRKLSVNRTNSTAISVTDTFYAAYAVVRLKTTRPSARQMMSDPLFIGTRPAYIKVLKPTDSMHPFQHLQLKDAWDFGAERRDMEQFTGRVKDQALAFHAANSEKLATGDKRTWSDYNVIMDSLRRRQLDYVVAHPDSYWSFYIFRAFLYRYAVLSPESFLSAFMKFPESFRFTNEGSTINSHLNGLQQRKIAGLAPDFTATDVLGRRITLSAFRDKHYVLLHFWATWCVPCIAELPVLKQLHDRYGKQGLQIISIAYSSAKETDYSNTLVKYGMDWINIYEDRDLLTAYGLPPTPCLMLLDQQGAIILDSKDYSSQKEVVKALADLIDKLSSSTKTIPQAH